MDPYRPARAERVSFPSDRVFLGRSILEPTFSRDASSLYFALQDGGSTCIARLDVGSGLVETITTTPEPSAGVLYGGGLFAVSDSALVYAARDGRVHRLDLGTGDQAPVTPVMGAVGAPVLSPCGRFLAFVADRDDEAAVFLADLQGTDLVRMPGCLAFSCDPVFGADGSWLAFQTWHGDQMPWVHSELRIVRFRTPLGQCEQLHQALPAEVTTVAAAEAHLAFPIAHPDPRKALFVSDESGTRAPWVLDLDSGERHAVARLEGEIGSPNWVQRMMPMALEQDGESLLAISRHEGVATLLRVELASGQASVLPSACRSISSMCAARDRNGVQRLAYVGSSPASRPTLWMRELGERGEPTAESARVSAAVGLWSSTRLAGAELVRWETAGGTQISGVLTRLAEVDRTPLVVLIHGGPTSCAELGWDPLAQFFATRGYACLAVNHRGSTQRGRAFQDLLRGAWGMVDVEDARTGAQAMVDRGIADPSRLVVMGGSSGGYTALMCLATDPDFWAAGVAMYPLADLYDAAKATHRFERPYQSWLVGPLPQAAATWRARSPIQHVSRVRAPVLLFHGTDDKAVPYQQSVDFAQAISRQGGVAQLTTYEGEGHGFRQPAHRRDMLDRIEAFLDKFVRFGRTAS